MRSFFFTPSDRLKALACLDKESPFFIIIIVVVVVVVVVVGLSDCRERRFSSVSQGSPT
jgi:hypothetical protein